MTTSSLIKPSRKVFFTFIALSCIFIYIWSILSPPLPKESQPIIFYSNQRHADLRLTMLKAIRQAQKSLHMIMFGLSDNPIINAILQKQAEDLSVKIFYDKRSSPKLPFPKTMLTPVKTGGLLHQKILVLDEKRVFIGSANMTASSLSMHDNLIIGLYSPQIAKFLINKTPHESGHMITHINGQPIELWLLPDTNGQAIHAIKNLLRAATHSIHIAMFTLTHRSLVDEIIKAHKRGVRVNLFLDFQSSIHASKKMYDKLRRSGVNIKVSKGPQLLHHKYAYIDNKILISGSTNWTKSAFKRNKDCFCILYDLTRSQKKFMSDLVKIMDYESK